MPLNFNLQLRETLPKRSNHDHVGIRRVGSEADLNLQLIALVEQGFYFRVGWRRLPMHPVGLSDGS
jgi:hypothetical protein